MLEDCSFPVIRCSVMSDFAFHFKLNIQQMLFMEEEEKPDITTAFKSVETKRELAELLGSSLKNLAYNLYKLSPDKQYEVFKISKRNGGFREICAPISRIKTLQKQLASILLNYQASKFCVHGYVKQKSIKTNAYVHRRKRIVINLDLKDFFNAINFGRVRGLFKSYPFDFNDEVATTLAQICCYEGRLPQGAPTSPIVSNYICRKLDNQLVAFAREHKMDYTRYADDITFSTNLNLLPTALGRIRNKKIVLSVPLKKIIENNGFAINEDKTRYALKTNRQEVTGLIVNAGVNVPRKYVKRIRAMLHAWEKYGVKDAAKEHFEKFNYKHKHPDYPEISFKYELMGMVNYVGQIKGRGSRVYFALYSRIKKLDSTIKLSAPENISAPEGSTIIFCEGKTDRLHLEAAHNYFKQQGEFVDLNLHFFTWRADLEINNDYLYQMCRTRPQAKRDDRIEIYLFDRDDSRYTKNVCEGEANYKYWESNVYSALLPVPEHRDFKEVCIEHFYSDADMMKKDENGYRLYTTKEFDPTSGNHLFEKDIYFAGSRNQLLYKYPKILESNVRVLGSDKNVALPKNNFARNIVDRKGDFKNVLFDHFKPIFEIFREIIQRAR